MKVWRSVQLYRNKNHVSHAIPRPVAMLLVATALLHHGSMRKMELVVRENAPVLSLINLLINYRSRQHYIWIRVKGLATYAARATS